ncbi:MAG: hypothetical protein AAFW97_00240 [Pseudomonadota bacterium]
MKLLGFLIALAGSVTGSAAAQACSVTDDYRVPTNIELVAQADMILLARVDGGPGVEEALRLVQENPPAPYAIIIAPLLALKGDLPETSITIPETYIATPSEYDLAVPSNPYNLREAHADAFSGGCARSAFLEGRTVVFFLSEVEDGVLPMSYPFSRWAEDVPSQDAPWVRAIRIYADVLELPEAERQASLIATRDQLLALEDDLDAGLIAADIDRQLADWDRDMQDASPSDGDDAAYEAMRDMEAAADDLAREMEEAVEEAIREMEEEAATSPRE